MKFNKQYRAYLVGLRAWRRLHDVRGDKDPEVQELGEFSTMRNTMLPTELNVRAGRYLFNQMLSQAYKKALEQGHQLEKPPVVRDNKLFAEVLGQLSELNLSGFEGLKNLPEVLRRQQKGGTKK